jgi:transcriptional regulator
MDEKTDLLQGTLALMILKTLQSMGPQHGFGIARRIEQVSGGALQLNHGTVYPALVRLEHEGWIKGKWGVSDNNRRARFYDITPRGRKQIAAEASRWNRIAGVVERFLDPADEGSAS